MTYADDNAFPGLTKREWFAGMALNGLLSTTLDFTNIGSGETYRSARCRIAIEYADAIIERLNQKEIPPNV